MRSKNLFFRFDIYLMHEFISSSSSSSSIVVVVVVVFYIHFSHSQINFPLNLQYNLGSFHLSRMDMMLPYILAKKGASEPHQPQCFLHLPYEKYLGYNCA